MKEKFGIEKWRENMNTYYLRSVADIYANDKNYVIGTEEEDKFAYAFIYRIGSSCRYPLAESWSLAVHTQGLKSTDLYYQLWYYIWDNDTELSESEKLWDIVEASFFAEMFFLRLFSYFEKLSHLMNSALGYHFDTRKLNREDSPCSFYNVCDLIKINHSDLLNYLKKIKEGEIYKKIKHIRHELTHRLLTFHNLAGSQIYPPDIRVKNRNSPKKTVIETFYSDPPKKDGLYEKYEPEEVYKIIDEATDLLVEVKRRVLEYADKIGYNTK